MISLQPLQIRKIASKLPTRPWKRKLLIASSTGITAILLSGAILYEEYFSINDAIHLKISKFAEREDSIFVIHKPDLVVKELEAKVDPWDSPAKCLKLTSSKSREERIQGVKALAKKHLLWNDSQYRMIAQACDSRALIGLARSNSVDKRFFLKPPLVSEPRENSGEGWKKLLNSLPQNDMTNQCAVYFTAKALKERECETSLNRGGLWFSDVAEVSDLTFAKRLIPEEDIELLCLQALLVHSEIPSHCDLIVSMGGLQLLMQVASERKNNNLVLCKITRILGNIAIHEGLHQNIVQSGWLGVLTEWMKSENIALASHSARVLANLDRDFIKEKYENGIYLIHPVYRSEDPIYADVIFVHGLRGGAFRTWRQKNAPLSEINHNHKNKYTYCWPKTWLAKDCPNIRILTVEYDTHLTDWAPQCPYYSEKRSIINRSKELLTKLEAAGVGKRPVVWVTHSMGGILVKDMLINAHKNQRMNSLIENTRGIIFISTPHLGSLMATNAKQLSALLYPSVEVKELSQDSKILQQLNSDFKQLFKMEKFECLSFGEKQPLNLGPLGTYKQLVVSPESANPGYGDFTQLDVNHLEVCKPDDKNSKLYHLILTFITNCIETCVKSTSEDHQHFYEDEDYKYGIWIN